MVIPGRLAAAAALALAALAACNAKFAPQYLVADLRILDVRAEVSDPPPDQPPDTLADVQPGETLRLTALVGNPGGAPLTVRWKACPPLPGQAVPPCLDSDYVRDPARLDGAPGVLDLGEGVSVEVKVPPEVAPFLDERVALAQSQPAYACTLYVEVPVLAIATAGGEQRTAVKRVRVVPTATELGSTSTAYVTNHNPVPSRVVMNPSSPSGCDGGTPIVRACASDAASDPACDGRACVLDATGDHVCADERPPPGGEVTLCALPGGTYTPEGFHVCEPDGTRVGAIEEVLYQWYATGGTFGSRDPSAGSGTGNQTDARVTFFPPDGPFTLWLLFRDGRGGTGWLRRDFR